MTRNLQIVLRTFDRARPATDDPGLGPDRAVPADPTGPVCPGQAYAPDLTARLAVCGGGEVACARRRRIVLLQTLHPASAFAPEWGECGRLAA